ncbi:MAG: helix-turn-helix domain-containing protein [Patescibacteria group bacterium]|jgi:sugar-specific transcriptional regulator TrmB
MYTEVLQQLGLPRNQAKIYESLLVSGGSNISSISSNAKVNRRNVYDSIKCLLERELVVCISDTGEQLYEAVDPADLQKILTVKTKIVQNILPELNNLYSAKKTSNQVSIERGWEGMKNFWKFILTQKDPVLFIGGKGAWHDPKIEEERKNFFSSCKKQGIRIQGIFDHEILVTGKDIYENYDPKWIRFFPEEYSTFASIDICGDQVIHFSMPKERTIEDVSIFRIINTDLADSYRTWFNYLWKQAKSL